MAAGVRPAVLALAGTVVLVVGFGLWWRGVWRRAEPTALTAEELERVDRHTFRLGPLGAVVSLVVAGVWLLIALADALS